MFVKSFFVYVCRYSNPYCGQRLPLKYRRYLRQDLKKDAERTDRWLKELPISHFPYCIIPVLLYKNTMV